MDYNILKELISQNLSTQGIANQLNSSQTNVRYWLRKYGLNTNFLSKNKDLKDSLNGRNCSFCEESLVGQKAKFCNSKCKHSYHYNSSFKENGNTNERQKIISKERKLKLIEMSGGGCEICGYNKNYSALQFHHLNPENKTFNLDSRKLSNTKWSSIEIEWGKCQLLCANCHAETHNPDKNINTEENKDN